MQSTDATAPRRVLLIRPPIYRHFTEQIRSYAPVGLASIAAGLREAGHEVEILDAEIGDFREDQGKGIQRKGLSDDGIAERVRAFAPDAVGLSCMFAVSMPAIVELAQLVRPLFDGPLVAGGYAATSDPEYLLENTPIDAVIQGEGEFAFAKFLARWPDVESIVAPTWERDIGSYPRPAYDLIDLDAYREYETTFVGLPQEALHVRSVGVQSSRGCPVGCNFCSVQLISGTPLRTRDPVEFVDELIHLRDELGIGKIHFFDDNLTLNRKHALRVFREMAERCPMPWVATQGTGAWNWDEELLDAAKASGMMYLSLPIESGSEYVLHEIMHKRPLKLSQVEDVVRMCRERDIAIFAWVIIGSPGETKADMELGLHLLNRLDVDYRLASVVTPYPGSALFDECAEKGYIDMPFDFARLRMARGSVTTPDFTADYTTARVAAWTMRGRIKTGQGVRTALRKCRSAYGTKITLRAVGLAIREWWRYSVRGIDPFSIEILRPERPARERAGTRSTPATPGADDVRAPLPSARERETAEA